MTMNCSECGKQIEKNVSSCPECGCPNEVKDEVIGEKFVESAISVSAVKEKEEMVFTAISIISFILACIFYYQGYDRMMNYSAALRVNVWVGGDAYNLIINGTHSIAFFVLAVGFTLFGISMIILLYLAKIKKAVTNNGTN